MTGRGVSVRLSPWRGLAVTSSCTVYKSPGLRRGGRLTPPVASSFLEMAAQKWSWSEARDPWGRARPQGRAALQTKQTRGRAGRLPFLWASQGQSGRKMHTSNYFRNVPCLRATVRGCAAAGRVSRADGGPEAPLGGLPGGCRHRAPCQHRTSPQGHRDGSDSCCSQARKGTATCEAREACAAGSSVTHQRNRDIPPGNGRGLSGHLTCLGNCTTLPPQGTRLPNLRAHTHTELRRPPFPRQSHALCFPVVTSPSAPAPQGAVL